MTPPPEITEEEVVSLQSTKLRERMIRHAEQWFIYQRRLEHKRWHPPDPGGNSHQRRVKLRTGKERKSHETT